MSMHVQCCQVEIVVVVVDFGDWNLVHIAKSKLDALSFSMFGMLCQFSSNGLFS